MFVIGNVVDEAHTKNLLVGGMVVSQKMYIMDHIAISLSEAACGRVVRRGGTWQRVGSR